MKRKILLQQNQRRTAAPASTQAFSAKIVGAEGTVGPVASSLANKQRTISRDLNVRNKSAQSRGSTQSAASRKLKFIIKKKPFQNKFTKSEKVT